LCQSQALLTMRLRSAYCGIRPRIFLARVASATSAVQSPGDVVAFRRCRCRIMRRHDPSAGIPGSFRSASVSILRAVYSKSAAQNRAYLLPSAKTINLGGLKCFYSAMKAQDASDIINVGRRFRNGAVIQEFFVKSSRSTRFSPDRITSCRCPSKGFCSQRLTLTSRSTSPARTRQGGWVEAHWRTLLPQGRRGGKRQDQSPNSS
jgi:hypothetical protein